MCKAATIPKTTTKLVTFNHLGQALLTDTIEPEEQVQTPPPPRTTCSSGVSNGQGCSSGPGQVEKEEEASCCPSGGVVDPERLWYIHGQAYDLTEFVKRHPGKRGERGGKETATDALEQLYTWSYLSTSLPRVLSMCHTLASSWAWALFLIYSRPS